MLKRALTAGNQMLFMIFHKESQQIIGASGFNDRSKLEVPLFEIGYWLETAFTGQGFATEMVYALTDFAFESFKAARVQIVTQVGNEASRRVAEKCGFILEATLKNYCVDSLSKKLNRDFVYSKKFDSDIFIKPVPLEAAEQDANTTSA